MPTTFMAKAQLYKGETMIQVIIHNGTKKTYSDSGLKIRKVGTNEIYDEAVDLTEKNFEYEETNEFIDQEQGGTE